MLYNFLVPLADQIGAFNIFRYITFRAGGAIITALFISFIVGPWLINWLKKKQKSGQPIRKDGPLDHLKNKKGTPTMGGLIILIALVVSTILWSDLTNFYIWSILFVTACFGLTGVVDDFLKIKKSSSVGLSGKTKFLVEIIISLIAILWILHFQDYTNNNVNTSLSFPFIKNLLIDLGWFFIPFSILVIVGSSNSVNLTDGLDGLAIVPIMIAFSCFAVISYLVGNALFSNYLNIIHIAGAGELTIFCGALVGAGLGFLWYNAPPAMVFMGDTGSLPVGAALGLISVITKHELVLVIIGGLFVLETISVIGQVVSFKLTGKRIFTMAPLHHHYEQKGWKEQTIVIRFWIIATILGLIGLATLKLR